MFILRVDDEITLRLHDEAVVADLFALIQTNQAYLSAHLSWPVEHQTQTSTRRFIHKARHSYGQGQGIGTAIYYKGQLAGSVGLQIRNASIGSAEIGYWLGEALTGKGIITRSVRAMMDYSFTTLGLHKIIIRCATNNPKSAAIPIRLNFSEDGIEKHGAIINDQYIDFRIFRMLADDWEMGAAGREFAHQVDDKLELRVFSQRDAQALFELTERNREHLSQWLPGIVNNRTLEDTQHFIADALSQYADNNGMHIGIWFKGALCGAIGYHYWDFRNRKTELGYWLDQATTGQGIMTRSVQTLVTYAVEVLELQRIEIYCAMENERSCAIPKRLGFTHEGNQRGKQWLHNRYHDTAIYAMLSQNWKSGDAHISRRY